MGRVDGQVKVRGFRVEVGEVESVLASHPGVSAAVVTAWGEDANRRLVAYVVPADLADGMPPVADLRSHVLRRLPEFMVPAAFVELARVPVTANGKVDRAALPAPEGTRPETAGFTPPSTPTQQLLAGIWSEVLDVPQIGIDDSFFELGGHSLLATQVISRIRDVFGVEIALGSLFDQPTVAATAAAINAATLGITADAGEYDEFEF